MSALLDLCWAVGAAIALGLLLAGARPQASLRDETAHWKKLRGTCP